MPLEIGPGIAIGPGVSLGYTIVAQIDDLTTENSDPLITEDGDNIILEN